MSYKVFSFLSTLALARSFLIFFVVIFLPAVVALVFGIQLAKQKQFRFAASGIILSVLIVMGYVGDTFYHAVFNNSTKPVIWSHSYPIEIQSQLNSLSSSFFGFCWMGIIAFLLLRFVPSRHISIKEPKPLAEIEIISFQQRKNTISKLRRFGILLPLILCALCVGLLWRFKSPMILTISVLIISGLVVIAGTLGIAFLRQCPRCKHTGQSFSRAFCTHCGINQEIVFERRQKMMDAVSLAIWMMGLCISVLCLETILRQSTQIPPLIFTSSLVGFISVFCYLLCRLAQCPICGRSTTFKNYCIYCRTCLRMQKAQA
jgi:hypothetical protein